MHHRSMLIGVALLAACQQTTGPGALAPTTGAPGTDQGEHPREPEELFTAVPFVAPTILASPTLPETGPRPGQEVAIDIAHREQDYSVLAVAPDGTVYGQHFTSGSTLYVSTDNARTWTQRSKAPDGIRMMTVLQDGVLLANTNGDGQNWLSRSSDGGMTWERVLDLGEFRMLTPHSVAELNGDVFYGEYQTGTSGATDIRVWVSHDRGATWVVQHTFDRFRHLHGLIADPATNTLWGLAGDSTGELVKSTDGGKTWTTVLKKQDVVNGVAVAVVGVPLPGGGLLYGVDAINRPRSETGIVRIDPDGKVNYLRQLPGPSYAIKRHSSGAFLLGVSREPSGNVYAPGDYSARLFTSADGETWNEVLAYERINDSSNAHMRVFWELPSGEVVIEVENVKGFGDDGEGYLIARPQLRPAATPAP